MSRLNKTTRRTFVKGVGCAALIAGAGLPVMAKAKFDPATFVKAMDRYGYIYMADVAGGKLKGLHCNMPAVGKVYPEMDAIYDRHNNLMRKTEGGYRIVGEYLVSVGRFYGTAGGAI